VRAKWVFGWDDGAIVAGLLLLAWAIWQLVGLPALVGFAGSLLLVIGMAASQGRRS
jgi:hypothetical protein